MLRSARLVDKMGAMTVTESAKFLDRDTTDHTTRERSDLSSVGACSRSFEALVAPRSSATAWPAGDVVGLEHEYRVFVGARAVDFRTVVHHLDLGRPRLDPADPNAYRLASGAALTADDEEAEIALAPSFVRPGCGYRLASTARSERRALERRLADGAHLEGYSTHLSVAVRPSSSAVIAKLYARSFSAAMMLLMDSACSPGLLVRPRPSRLELGGEFVDGDRLVVAAIFAVGSIRACQRRLEGGVAAVSFPGRLVVDVQRDDQRYGWFVSRSAFATDLYLAGREAALRPQRGSPITAQAHLERCWAAARATLVEDVDETELALVDRVVRSDEPLPAPTPAIERRSLSRLDTTRVTDDEPARAFGSAVRAQARPGYDLAPVMLTWDRAVFVLSAPRRDRLAFASVPAPLLMSFFSQLDAGALDETILSYLALSPRGRLLRRATATARPGLYDRLAPRAWLLVPEKAPRPVRRGGKRTVSGAIGRGWRFTAGFVTGVRG